ncbi:polymorphic toxin-type HINT domain-containing protein [Streptomyces sp. ECR3]|uniref:polymorphic toxin-type HINT domain-containing protein n=1 Tax=Streptomyces sp. ECR3 TaxID=3400630 RepID=UPI003F1B57DF
MVAALLQAVAFTPAAEAAGKGLPAVSDPDKPVLAGAPIKVKPRTTMKGPRTPAKKPKAAWPEAGSALVELKKPAAKAGSPVPAKGLPLKLNTPAKRVKSATGGPVQARVLGNDAAQKAGIDGLLVSLEAQDKNASGTVGATVDYSSFAQAFGGSYASRLTLVELPACALTTPVRKSCRTTTPLATTNDTESQTLTASKVSVQTGAKTVLAAVADDSGKTGDFKATSLSPSSTWSTNLSTGDFSWSYNIPVPAVPGDMTPGVGLSYSSGSIDGRTSNTNNQSSWVGDGFDLWPGSIERRYKPCADDGQKADDGVNKPADMCWGYDNAYISLNGKGGELVPVDDGEWRLKKDDGTRIVRLKSTDRANSDADGEYWRVTDPKGNRYYFGYNRLPGWEDGKETTDSTWSVPVYGDDSGEPCHKDTFADSWCQQAWRWNLDYAVDTHGNAIAYYYNKETNSYGRNLKAADDTRYTRGGYLDRIEYGLKSSSMYSAKALAKVDFASAERCIPSSATDCSSISKDAFYWYDTPWDMNCDAGTDCDTSYSPTFWTRKRLTGITTQALKGDDYSTVDSWALAHRWGQADIDYQLLLDSIQHTGHTATTPITLPKTTFAYTQLENRLDKIGDGYAPYIKARLSTIADEYGGQTDVDYSAPACDATDLPTPQTNATRCFPQLVGGSDKEEPELQWFNKYVATSVTATDRTGGAPDAVTTYEYLDGAAWHYDDDDGLTKEKNKTWSQWRGYGHVRVKTGGQGGGTALKSQADSYFLRGMDGDRKAPSGGTKPVTVTLGADEGDPITDHESAAGFAYKTETYSAPGGKILEKAMQRPWHHETGKRERSWGTVTSNFTGTARIRTMTSLDDGVGSSWRTSEQVMTYDTVAGRLISVDDHGQLTVADNTCTRTTYATNTDDNILMLPSRQETVTGDCSDTPDRRKDVLFDVRTAYDGGSYGAAPTKGDATATAKLKEHDGTTATYLESGGTYDAYGRRLTSTDLTADVTATEGGTPVRTTRQDGLTSTTAYSPATGFPTTITTTTPPAKVSDPTTTQSNVTTLETLRGQPISDKDTNGNVTTYTYDALGRSDKVWLADRRTTQTPSYDFDYFVEENKPVAVRTLTLDNGGAQLPSYALYDGLLRARQTQDVGPDGGSLLTDNFYDERGQVARTFDAYYTTKAPSRELFKPADALSVETQAWHVYDGLGREAEAREVAGNGDGGKVLGITQTIYGGDRTTVIPPEGGTAITTLTDVRGQTTELRQHHTRSADATYDTTAYTYTPAGKLATVTDPARNEWRYTYDQLGRQTKSVDPDKGTTDTRYDDRSQVVTTTDDRGEVLHYTYDQLGRQTELRDDSATGTLRASWLYDTVSGAKGQLTSSTRYVGGAEYTSKVSMYDRLYRPIRTAITIPDTAENKGLSGTYQVGTSYKPSGLPAGVSYSAAGSLPGGSYSYSYDDTLRPTSILGNGFEADTGYSLTGKPLTYLYASTASGAKAAQVANTYEWGTQRLATSRVDRQDVPGVDRFNTYHYDEVGNVLSVSDISRAGTDNQCFTYDHLSRLTEAWTEADTACETTASANAVGGVAPYWQSYTYDKVGNRRTESLHDVAGDAGKDIQRTYTYPSAGAAQPHTLTEVNQTGPGGTAKTSYAYDATGNTVGRTLSGDTQKLEWDPEGHLAKVTQPVANKPDEVTSYIYDADGNRLIARGPNETTVYLGGTELVLAKGATAPKATRYIDLGGGSQAVQSDDGKVSITVADHLGTGQLAISVDGLALSQRRTLPFGGKRGESTGAWPGAKGYVGGTDDTDTTGLTHLGAREYDSSTGRFISVDPVMDLANPQQSNGYAYAENSPVTNSDPSGLMACATPLECGGGTQYGNNTPTRDSGGKPLNHPSWGCNGCDGDSYDDGWWVNSGWSEAPSGPTIVPGTVTIFPGYNVPLDYGHADALKQKLAKILTNGGWELGDLSQGITNPESQIDAQISAQVVGIAKFHACASIRDCPEGLWKAFAAAMRAGHGIALATGGMPGAGGGVRVSAGARGGKGRADSDTDCLHSFVSDTEVQLADGSVKAIEDVKTGDKVTTTNPKTGKTSAQEVVNTIVTKHDKHFVKITVSGMDSDTSNNSLTATATHPFWSPTEKTWINAGDLRTGITLRSPDGKKVKITSIRHFTQRQTTYDLTVNGVHTYYALAGITPVLVHNCSGRVNSADWHHIFNRHGASSRWPGKSTFSTDSTTTIRSLIEEALKGGKRRSNGLKGGHTHEYDFGRAIGYDRSGKPLTGVRVVVRNKRIVTAFPIKMGGTENP